ncbi:hypothetical protein SAMN04488054_1611 [Salibacterium qingdaonense]|uniref:Uncharacterized protein n=2 Tax=Salibacterium qingdaonense TaxID=266892 RepID=A0A1I4R3I2_9BACI|nr:hypothetical protein SAMN04488054_1611 [Salibacterium qingdaonense]
MPYSNNEAIDQEISHLRKFNSSVMVSKDIRERIKEINTLFKRYENNEIAKDYLKKTLELQLINIDHKLEMNSFAWMNSFLLRLVK